VMAVGSIKSRVTRSMEPSGEMRSVGVRAPVMFSPAILRRPSGAVKAGDRPKLGESIFT
jgi:hypothetical protein